ncbi:MAG: FtsB family cell division protein [Pseudonocardiaceae bacterium]
MWIGVVMALTRTAVPMRGSTAVPMRGSTAAPTRSRNAGTRPVRSPAVARAYARRAQRTGARHSGPGSPHGPDAGRAPFVVLVMTLLAVALVATLWLSTAAAADSYQLQDARTDARNLTERSEGLSREVASLETAPELARRARQLGMVPAGDPARLVVRPDGAVVVIGEARPVTAPVAPLIAAVAPLVPVPVPPAPVELAPAAPAPSPGLVPAPPTPPPAPGLT